MRKLMTILLAMALLCAPALAEEQHSLLSYQQIVDMAQYMRQLVMGDYLDIKQVPRADRQVAETWAAGINDTPRMVVELDIENQASVVTAQAVFSQEPPMVQYEAASTEGVNVWQYLAVGASEEAGVADAGYEEILRVNGHINAFRMFAADSWDGTAMYIVLYDDAAPILLISCAENGGVSIQGMFLPSPMLKRCQNYGQVSLYLMLNGVGMTCREIKSE